MLLHNVSWTGRTLSVVLSSRPKIVIKEHKECLAEGSACSLCEQRFVSCMTLADLNMYEQYGIAQVSRVNQDTEELLESPLCVPFSDPMVNNLNLGKEIGCRGLRRQYNKEFLRVVSSLIMILRLSYPLRLRLLKISLYFVHFVLYLN